jgi:tetratricopeptide (TPR) repeat protein
MESRDVVIEHHGYADQATLKCKAERNVKLMLEGRDTAEIDTVTAVEVADSYQLMEQWEEAIIWYKRVLSIPGCDTATPVLASQAHTGLGVIYNRQEKYDLAKSSLKKAVDLAPWRTDALFSLAVSYDLDGEKADAVRVLQKIIDSKPSPGQVGVDFRSAGIKAHLRLMRILADESDLSGAASAAQRALTAHPDRPEVAFMAAKIAAASGNLIEALKLYERCIALTGQGNLDVYIGLCLVYMKAGRIEVARKTLLSIEPLFSGLRRYRAFRMSILEEPAGHAGLTPEEASGEMAIIRRDYFLRAGAA